MGCSGKKKKEWKVIGIAVHRGIHKVKGIWKIECVLRECSSFASLLVTNCSFRLRFSVYVVFALLIVFLLSIKCMHDSAFSSCVTSTIPEIGFQFSDVFIQKHGKRIFQWESELLRVHERRKKMFMKSQQKVTNLLLCLFLSIGLSAISFF